MNNSNNIIVGKRIIWEAKLVTHQAKPRIAVYFPKSIALNERIKKIDGARWSNTLKAWHVPDTEENRLRFKIVPPVVLTDEQLKNIEKFKQWLQSKRYSENTIATYCDALKSFFKFYVNKTITEITNDDVIKYNNEYILKKGLSSSYQNQIVNAIKLFFRTVHNRSIDIDLIHRPKREKLLPNVLSKEEVKAILDAPQFLKHKAMLSLIYSCGLRCGELLRLKPEHIDANRNILIIKQAKGRKDRIAPLSDKTIKLLRTYFKAFKPTVYLFEGEKEGIPYNERSLQLVLKQCALKAGINKPITLHWLRHSYATHLLENGTDLRYIQEILGHRSSKTTEIYTHVSTKSIQKITSPFDSL